MSQSSLPSESILLVANSCWYIYNFRLSLLYAIREAGLNPVVVAPSDAFTSQLEQYGFTVIHWSVSRRSLNPLLELLAILSLTRIYHQQAPNLVHHFTIKACLYGTISAKLSSIPCVINSITGLGHVFVATRKRNRLFRRMISPLYSLVFNARRSTVLFQNSSDQERLISLGLVDDSRSRIIRGSGVDVDFFKPINSRSVFHSPLRILFPSRLILEKGIVELLSACQELTSQGIEFQLSIAGSLDTGNRSCLTASQLAALSDDNRYRLLGHVSDMRSLYEASDIVVLPSWREGLSRALIEAASMCLPIITTDVPGCHDVVEHGVTGLLVPIRDPSAIALAILFYLRNPEFAHSLGQTARLNVIDKFRASLINQSTINHYQILLDNRSSVPS